MLLEPMFRAAGDTAAAGGRSRSTGAGVVARGAGDPGQRLEPLHCSWVRAQGIRRFDTQRLEDRTSQSTRACEYLTQMWQWIAMVEDQEKEQPASLRAAGDIAPCGRRNCAVWQETLRRVAGDTAVGGKSRCAGCRTHGWGRCCGRQGTQPPRAERQAAEATMMGGRTLRRAAGDTVANGKRPCSGPQEPPFRGATGDCALCGRSCAVRQGSKSRCGRRQDVAASGRSCRTGGRSRTTGAGSVASARRQETLLGWQERSPCIGRQVSLFRMEAVSVGGRSRCTETA